MSHRKANLLVRNSVGDDLLLEIWYYNNAVTLLASIYIVYAPSEFGTKNNYHSQIGTISCASVTNEITINDSIRHLLHHYYRMDILEVEGSEIPPMTADAFSETDIYRTCKSYYFSDTYTQALERLSEHET